MPGSLMRHRIANIEDSEALGELNHQLIKDEGHLEYEFGDTHSTDEGLAIDL